MHKGATKERLNVFTVILLIILTLYGISLLVPFLWSLLSTFKDQFEFLDNPFGWPKAFTLKNYGLAFSTLQLTANNKLFDLWAMFLNSFLYAFGCTVASTLVHSVTAYLVAKYRFRFNKLVYGIVVVCMVLPIVGSLPSEIQLARAIGFYDNIIGLWIMKGNFLGMHFLMFYGTFKSLSWEYAEAAFIDGASHMKVMTGIMMPLAKTTIVIVSILTFIGYWNEYYVPMIFLPSMPTVAYGLYKFQSLPQSGNLPMMLTGCMLIIIPIMILFLIFKNKMIGNLTMGGIKG